MVMVPVQYYFRIWLLRFTLDTINNKMGNKNSNTPGRITSLEERRDPVWYSAGKVCHQYTQQSAHTNVVLE
jgi:hypothetical protein